MASVSYTASQQTEPRPEGADLAAGACLARGWAGRPDELDLI